MLSDELRYIGGMRQRYVCLMSHTFFSFVACLASVCLALN